MRSQERKPVIVIIDLSDYLAPTANAVALAAVASQLPAVNVCMTIGALHSDF
jgi:hypothetical protein